MIGKPVVHTAGPVLDGESALPPIGIPPDRILGLQGAAEGLSQESIL